MRKFISATIFLLLTVTVCSQQAERPIIKFGGISIEDFTPSYYSLDSLAHAVILFEVQKSEYEADSYGGFNVVYKYHKRMRLLNKTSFDEATIEIPINGGRMEDEIKRLEAATYNIENGNVIVTKVDKNSIYKDKVVKDNHVKKFTFPALKEGSIIEYQYTIVCPHERNLRSWIFQDRKYPTLWSEFDYTIPDVYRFLPIRKGLEDFVINKQDKSSATYSLAASGNRMTYNAVNTRQIYAMANVPALKEENYTTTINNYLSRIDFYLLSINIPGLPIQPVIDSWFKTAYALSKHESFGADLNESNGWMKDELETALGKGPDSLDKAKSLFNWVKQNFECTDHSAILLSQPLKKVLQAKKGSVAEINLLLTAMLRKAGFLSKPILLSTRSHGKPLETYPVLNQFNYLVSAIQVNGKMYLLDASEKMNAFGKLPSKCYNGTGRIIDENLPGLVDISADSVLESKLTSVFIVNDNSQKGLTGSFSSILGYYESQRIREKFESNTSEDFFKDVKKSYSIDIKLKNQLLDSLKDCENPVEVKYEFTFAPEQDIIYLNPMLAEATKENPFKSAERFYPVEMPFKFSEVYVFNMEIPKGYKVDEIPKSARVKLNENEGMFEYLISNNGSNIQLRSKIEVYKATFLPEDYQTLREFFDYVVKKHNEQIVFKKIQ